MPKRKSKKAMKKQQEELDKLKTEAEQSNKEKASLMQRLGALELRLAAPPAQQLAVQLTLEVAAVCHRTIMYTAADLPTLKAKPPAPYKRQLVLIAANLQQWLVYPNQPVTFGQLLTGAGSVKVTGDTFRTLQDLAGDVIWKRFYGDAEVTDGSYAPFQLREILLASLKAAEIAMAEFSKENNFDQQAKDRFATFCEEDSNAKRSRSGPYTAF